MRSGNSSHSDFLLTIRNGSTSKAVTVEAPRNYYVMGFVIALAGCATLNNPSVHASSDQLAINPFDVPGSRPDVLLMAKMEGVLHTDGRCITVRRDEEVVTPLWPGGTTIVDSDGRFLVRLPDDRGVATIGNHVSLSGGAFAGGNDIDLAEGVRQSCPARYFVVSTVE